ncbi:MAG: MarR family transcriptional regulator [Leucobacter sp.]|nr:MarR family transcriptional regulator [Leucobacter sp.]
MNERPREQAVRDLLAAVIGLVANWNAVSTQGSIARAVGVDIAAGDVRALYTLGLLGGAARPTEFAEALAQTRPTTSKLIGRLEVAGLVERSRAVGDLRAVDIVFTEQGSEAYARLVAAGASMVDQAMTGMATAEIDVITAAAKRLTGEFRE